MENFRELGVEVVGVLYRFSFFTHNAWRNTQLEQRLVSPLFGIHASGRHGIMLLLSVGLESLTRR